MSGSMLGNIWRMLLTTDLFGKLDILVLFVLSGYSWAIIITKARRFARLKKQGKKIARLIGSHRGVEILRLNLPSRDHPIAYLVDSVRQEIASQSTLASEHTDASRKDIIEAVSQRAEAAIEESLEREEHHLDFLAMTGNVAPFLGLLGTVWGITLSFWEIGHQSSANIAVVAPGLAEALITTIIGLLVAIPAVIAFNLFNTRLREIAGEVSNFGKRFVSQLKREL